MSNYRTLANEAKELLESLIPELKGCVVIANSGDVESRFDEHMRKAGGKCVLVAAFPSKNEATGKKAYYSGFLTATLSLASSVTRNAALDQDALVKKISDALHDWWPASVPSNSVQALKAVTILYPEIKGFASSTIKFSTPPIAL